MAFFVKPWYTLIRNFCKREGTSAMRKTFALFDFDGTLIPWDSIVRFCLFAREKGLCTQAQLRAGAWAAVRYKLRLSTARQSKAVALSFLTGRSQQEIAALSKAFFEKILFPALRPQAKEALARHRENGDTILFLTASPSFYLEPFKEAFGVTEIIGTRMDVDPSGVFTGFISGENCWGVEKPLRLAEYLAATGDRLDYDRSWAYGDSESDAPMLDLCAHKVAVNPGAGLKKKLKRKEGVTIARWAD
jgi:HAD superfamily hydrolase (TIGR01490 family)